MIPALIAAAASIGGSLWARRDAHQREDTSIQRRVADARRAGVHPVAALGAGGIGSSPAGSAFVGEGIARGGQAVGNALSRTLDTDSAALKALVLEKAGLENELLRTQVTRAKVEAGTVPSVLGPMLEYGIPGQSQTVRLPYVPGTSIAHKVESPTWTPNLHIGVPYRTNPHFSDAQAIQNRYGELAESLYGGVSGPADALYNARSTRGFTRPHADESYRYRRNFSRAEYVGRMFRYWRDNADHGLY